MRIIKTGNGAEAAQTDATASVSAQEVDPLTEYQVYKQFGYESKAAESFGRLSQYFGRRRSRKAGSWINRLNLRVGNIDMLADTLERHSASLSEDSVAEYLKAGLALDSTNLRLRVFCPSVSRLEYAGSGPSNWRTKRFWKLLPTNIFAFWERFGWTHCRSWYGQTCAYRIR